MVRQDTDAWRLIVVHDGPGQASAELVRTFAARDVRIAYLETGTRANDTGVTPRHVGAVNHLERGIDYCVFWDDDNWFKTGAIRKIAASIEVANWPELLVVGMKYGGRILPPVRKGLGVLRPGQIDSGCLVLRPQLAELAYAEMIASRERSPEKNLYTSDYMAFDYVRRSVPEDKIAIDTTVVVGFHDGLRWKPYIRNLLGLGPLGLARKKWFGKLTFGVVKPR